MKRFTLLLMLLLAFVVTIHPAFADCISNPNPAVSVCCGFGYNYGTYVSTGCLDGPNTCSDPANYGPYGERWLCGNNFPGPYTNNCNEFVECVLGCQYGDPINSPQVKLKPPTEWQFNPTRTIMNLWARYKADWQPIGQRGECRRVKKEVLPSEATRTTPIQAPKRYFLRGRNYQSLS